MVTSGAVLVEEPVGGLNVVDFTVADGAQISSGNLMVMSDNRTATSSAATDPGDSQETVIFAGIATSEKEASDGQTNLGLAQDGIWDVKTTSAATVGAKMMISGANTVAMVTEDVETLSGGIICGTALETGAANEVIEVDFGNR